MINRWTPLKRTLIRGGGILSLTFIMGCASSDPWTKHDTYREIAFQVVNAVDAHSTMNIQYADDLYEASPITNYVLGDQPKSNESVMYFATLGVSHYLISRALPEKWRKYWQNGTTIYGAYVVYGNCQHGLC